MISEEFTIRHSRPMIEDDDVHTVLGVLESGNLSSGPEGEKLETAFAGTHDKEWGLAFNSWTSAAYALFSYLAKSKPGTSVIIPSFSFVATANVVSNSGLNVIFADCNLEDGSLSIEAVKKLYNPTVSAVMTVHYAGIVGRDTSALAEFCNKNDLLFVEDCAEALGAHGPDGKCSGSFGVGIFSFFATKNISCGEGGMVVGNGDQLRKELSLSRTRGPKKHGKSVE